MLASASPLESASDLLVLHAVRLKGLADEAAVADRYALAEAEVAELLLDFEAYGWVYRVAFAETRGWALTERGRAEDERRLAGELAAGAETTVRNAYRDFGRQNERLLRACTDWQLRPGLERRLTENDHLDAEWDRRILVSLTVVASELATITAALAGALTRFAGYDERYAAALARVRRGEVEWVAKPAADSCHTVWMELHEDLIATLGEQR